jgi:hypothetical protein
MLEQYLEQKEMSNFKFKRKNKYESNAFFIPEFKSYFQENNLKN